MKQVININFQGRVVPIEVSAFDLLKNYIDSLSRHFANELGKEEIINDIESRIGELFQERLKNGVTCITDEDVNAVIKSMGRPEDFDSEEEPSTAQNSKTEQSSTSQSYQNTNTTATHKRLYRDENSKVLGGVCAGVANYFGIDSVIVRILTVVFIGVTFLPYIILWIALPSTASTEIGGTRKKFYRDTDDKLIAGVCSGIANYFGINVWVPRVLFLLPFLSVAFHLSHWGFMNVPGFFSFSFSPGALIVYIILWLVIPEATTTAEKLEMKGEKVDMNSIKNSVMEEMKGVQQRAEKFGQEAKAFAEEKGKTLGTDINNTFTKNRKSLGDVIVIIIKAFAYLIIGFVAFVLVITLFAIAIAAVGVFPFKNFVINDGWQNVYAWGTLLFFIGVPVIGVITWIIRRLAKIKKGSGVLRFTFISLNIIGWVCAVLLVASIAKQFKYESDLPEETVSLSNPTVSKLEITSPESWSRHNHSFHIGFFTNEDTFYANNIHFRIIKTTSDSFKVTVLRFANGATLNTANNTASFIEYPLLQTDTLLQTCKGIAISRANKFRNQRVVYTIYVPVGKHIKIDQSVWDNHFDFQFNVSWDNDDDNWEDYWGNEEHGWTTNIEYIMKADGLYKLDGTKAGSNDDDDDDKPTVNITNGSVDIHDNNSSIKINSNGVVVTPKEGNAIQKTTDSLKQIIEKQKDSLEKERQKFPKPIHQDAFMAPVGLSRFNSLM